MPTYKPSETKSDHRATCLVSVLPFSTLLEATRARSTNESRAESPGDALLAMRGASPGSV
jgi:hypothetical protein